MSPRAPTDKPLGAPLLAWFERNRRALPWRETSDPYRVWLSEVMLQQTRVDVVIPYYERFLERFPSLESLASAREEEVLALWSGLGYYRRARSLHAGARTIVERHSGRFPRSADEALEVPGVGPYTAGAVLSIAYNLPEPVVDGNVERVLTRVHALPGDPRKAANARVIRGLARAAIPRGKAARFNQALMELGALVCLPRSPRCGECPLSSLCEAARVGQPERFPELPPERDTVQINLHAAVILDGEAVLLVQVAEGSYLRGLWLPPLAVGAPAAVDPSDELERNIAAATGARLELEGHRGRVSHSITFRRFRVEVFGYRVKGRRASEVIPGATWAPLQDLGRSVPVSSLALKVLGRGPRRPAEIREGWRPEPGSSGSPRRRKPR